MISTLGVDLAASPDRTWACTLEETEDGAICATLHARCDDDELLARSVGRTRVGIDAPFGWPSAFVEALAAHQAGQPWPALDDDDDPKRFRDQLRFRRTDRVAAHTRQPLSVSTDRLGVTAMRCAHLLRRLAGDGEPIDRTGADRVLEVYPAGAIRRWDLVRGAPRATTPAMRGQALDDIAAALPALRLSREVRGECVAVDHAFDALVCSLVARAAALRLTDGPTARDKPLARAEGWIHLPLRGSLPFLDRPRRTPTDASARALAAALAKQGAAVDEAGYVGSLSDALVAGLSTKALSAVCRDLAGKGGSELVPRRGAQPKFHAAHSSAALAASTFAPWLAAEEPLPLGEQTFRGPAGLEVECPTGLRGTPPTLDLLLDGPLVLAVESKCLEPFGAHEARFSDAYDRLVTEIAHRSWQDEHRRLIEDPRRYRHLDAAQLVKHYLGLKRRGRDRKTTLAHLYWEPSNADELLECAIHRAELREFEQQVADPAVQLLALPYPRLWRQWEHPRQPRWLRLHAGRLQDRYDVKV